MRAGGVPTIQDGDLDRWWARREMRLGPPYGVWQIPDRPPICRMPISASSRTFVTKPINTKIAAPVAPRHSHSFTTHGITVTDDYAWLKDAKWQEVLRDPAILDPGIRRYLEAENGYTESLLGHTD